MADKETAWEYEFWNSIKKWGVDDLSFKQIEWAYKIAHKREHGFEVRPGGISPKDQERVDQRRKSMPDDDSYYSDMARSNDSEVLAGIIEMDKITALFKESQAREKAEEEHKIFLEIKAERDRIFYARQAEVEAVNLKTESHTGWMKEQSYKWILMTVVDDPDFVCKCGTSPDPAKCGNHKHHYLNVQDQMECFMCLKCRMKLSGSVKSHPDYKSLSVQEKDLLLRNVISIKPVDRPRLLR